MAAVAVDGEDERLAEVKEEDPMDRLALARREFGEWGGVNASIEASATFSVLAADTLPAIFAGRLGPAEDRGGCYLYSRAFNPTVAVLGRQLAALEGTEAAYCAASGMAAVSAALLALCDAGDHVVCAASVYGGTHALLSTFLPRKAGITATFVPIADAGAVEAAVRPGRTKAIFCESVANPTLAVADVPALRAVADRHGLTLVVDNTFAPLVCSPARAGAHVVVASLTKFVSGSADVLAGAVCGSAAFVASLLDLHAGPLMLLGPVLDAKVAHELSLRLPHLGLRVAEHSRRAAAYAARLAALGAAVAYPGLPSHPQHAVAARLFNHRRYGFGGLLAVDCGCAAAATALMERLQNKHGFGLMAVSLGYFDTLMSMSAASTSSELAPAALAAAGVAPGLLRLSAGLTGSLPARLAQLEEAWRAAGRAPPGAARAPFKAAALRRRADGTVARSASWASFGGGDAGEDAAAAAAAADSDAATEPAAEPAAAAEWAARAPGRPPLKVRRTSPDSAIAWYAPPAGA